MSGDEPIRLAATIMIARQAEPQFEILMLKRTSTAVFAGGMYVFPGGMVDPGDGHDDYLGRMADPSADQVGQTAAVGVNWHHFWLAGIRETFEEAGLLLAYDEAGALLRFTKSNEDRFAAYRRSVFDGEMSLLEVCRREKLQLAVDRVHFYNRLITPPGRPRRFDTHFFLTAAPADQVELHDGTETVGSLWISPSEALRRHRSDEFGLMGATQRQLTELDAYQNLTDLMEMARTRTEFPTHAYARIPAGS